ncbi:MAG: bifunctional metallophosphatase/5'-nucleotidase [Hyphomicrobiales bacterium]|nr:bifunctional metallophosphatase/5'-nucleotidase [Hyphomicrobiales bacterium]
MKPLYRALGTAAWLSLAAAPAFAAEVTITFVQTNDIDRMNEKDGRGGFARLATVVEAERAKGPTFFIHSGDTLSPSILSGLDKGAHIIDILNNMNVDMLVPGNHEFDFGPEVFRQRIGEATFPVIASNLTEADGSAIANTVDTKMTEVDGVKLGFYGLTTEDTRVVSSPGDIVIAPAVEIGVAKTAELRDAGADLVIGVMHTPIDDDLALARAAAGDLILTGHDEHLLAFHNGRTAMTESESQANSVVITEITVIKEEDDDGSVDVSWHPTFRIVDTADVEPHAEIAALVETYSDRLDEEMKVEIGTIETPLDSRRASVRSEETAIGNLIADAMRQAVDADIAITNGGGIRADREYESGTALSRGDILAELPFGNKTVKLQLSGAAIHAALENGFSQVENGAGRFPQVSGLVVETNYGRPAGERVLSIMVNGAPLDHDATYTLATNDYMARGGDGYSVLSEGKSLIDPIDATLMASQVIDFITAAGTVAPKVEGRINAL